MSGERAGGRASLTGWIGLFDYRDECVDIEVVSDFIDKRVIVGREDVIEEVFVRVIDIIDMIVGLIDRVFSGCDVDFVCFGHVIIIQSRVYHRALSAQE